MYAVSLEIYGQIFAYFHHSAFGHYYHRETVALRSRLRQLTAQFHLR